MVVKDCAETLRQILGCVSPYVDEIVLVLGGESSDDTEAVAREFTEKVYPFEWVDDFAAARNFALSHVTEPYWMWLDGDDIALTSAQALPDIVQAMEKKGVSCTWFPYIYQTDKFGNPTQTQVRERIFRREDGWYWLGRVHEVVNTDKPNRAMMVYEGNSVIHSEKAEDDNRPSVERNARLLRQSIKDEPEKMRHVLALAHAQFALDDLPGALKLYERYYYQPESPIEQWWSACQMARIHLSLKDWQVAKGWALAALQVDGRFKDPYCLMAHACWWGEENADEALSWAVSTIGKEEAPLAICRTPREYTLNLWEVMHRAYAAKGDAVKAFETAKKGRELEPTDHWDRFIRLYAEAVRAEDSAECALRLADHMVRRGDTLRARWLFDNYLPANIRDLPQIKKAHDQLCAATAHAYYPSAYKEFYSDTTPRHNFVGTVLDEFRWQWVFDRLEKCGAKTVLDVGCANGAPALELGRRGYEVTGIDIHAGNIKKAAKSAKKGKLPCRFEVADLEEYYRRVTADEHFEPFDVVLLAELIEHLPPHLVNHYLLRADALGKRVIITTPSPLSGDWAGLGETGPSVFSPTDMREHLIEFRQEELEQLLLGDGRRPIELYTLTQPWDEADDIQQRTWVAEYDHEPTNDQPVVFLVGPGHEHWTPHSVDKGGIGGSETAVVRMAQEFAQRGHRVVVYAEAEGVYDGVVYRHHRHFNPEQQPWLLLVSRQPAVLALDLKAQNVFFMAHDIHYGPDVDFSRADKVLVLSEWHRQSWVKQYGEHPGLTITANGIVPPTGSLTEPQSHRFIYASSPDRGLHVLLRWWPEILKMWSDAELHIFYGFQNLVSMAQQQPHLLPFKMEIEALVAQEGIVWEGRVGQAQLHEEFAQSRFWLYPSIMPNDGDWYETFCIAALEAQANGCIPLTRPVGALPERVALPDLCLIDSRDPKVFLKALRRWDKMPPQQREKLRGQMAQYARECTWTKVYEQWMELARAPVLA